MKKLLPLTPGLVASALLRYDHGLFAPQFEGDIFSHLNGDPKDRMPELIDRIVAIYDDTSTGGDLPNVTEQQVAEEFTGDGFYRVEAEENYAAMLDQYGARAYATEVIGHRGKAIKST